MPAPTNLDALTATALGALPATATQLVDFAGTTYTVWYSFVVPVNCLVIGAFAFGDLTTYKPTIRAYNGPASAPVQILSVSAQNRPIQFPVTAGATVYLEMTKNGGNPTPANLTLNVQVAPTSSVPTGSLLINDDTIGYPMAALSGTTGDVSQFFAPFPSGEGGSILNDGTTIWEDINVSNQAKIFSPVMALTQTVNVTFGSGNGLILSSNKTTKFYAGDPGSGATHAKVGTISTAGVIGGMIYTLAAAGLTGMAPSLDETILYYGGASSSISPIARWDLVNNVALSDLVPLLSTYSVRDILTLTDGTILVLYTKGNGTLVKQYSAAGATLNTYDFGTANTGSHARSAAALDDPNSFWIWLHTNDNRFENIKISDGSALKDFSRPSFEGGAYQDAATATPTTRFGASQSCPLLISRTPIGPPSPPIISTTDPIRRLRQTQHLSDDQLYQFFSSFQLDGETGVGLVDGQGSDPQVMLSWSDDGGHTWSSERWVSFGKSGQFRRRAIWRMLGRSRDRVWRIVVSDPVPWRFLQALVNVEAGNS